MVGGDGDAAARQLRDVQLVKYHSGKLSLSGWLIVPPAETNRARPGVVYLHNDFSLTTLSYENAKPLAQAGFPVFLPTLRAENGNPGDFELLFGEVDDAKAAVSWFAEVDERFVYVIGHSIGGGIAALMSLHPDVRVRLTASVGGIYRARTFVFWATRGSTRHLIRFDPTHQAEVTQRLLGPNVRDMVHPHLAYAGRDDEFDRRYAEDVARAARPFHSRYQVVLVDGDHMSSIAAAIADLVRRIREDARGATEDQNFAKRRNRK